MGGIQSSVKYFCYFYLEYIFRQSQVKFEIPVSTCYKIKKTNIVPNCIPMGRNISIKSVLCKRHKLQLVMMILSKNILQRVALNLNGIKQVKITTRLR